ncbi:hypothetical protein NQ176_g3907 [Zarea fungicola]|uniref:Uncharacterized protein n=1 Tax=Zarea fungicola TaxID=93591 RepID=A0ACC1NIC6_9HYPO|nr:hypothetical protein NQ176_g3907 [Lecanicillium fungicola]
MFNILTLASMATTAAAVGICTQINVNTGGCDTSTCREVHINLGQSINIPDLHLPGGVGGLAGCFTNSVVDPGFDLKLFSLQHESPKSKTAQLSNFKRIQIGQSFHWVVSGTLAKGHSSLIVASIKRTGN